MATPAEQGPPRAWTPIVVPPIRRYYQATFIADHDADLAMSFVCIPYPSHDRPRDAGNVARFLGIDLEGDLSRSPSWLPYTFARVIDAHRDWSSDDLWFLEWLAYSPVIPFEASPLSGHALSSLLLKGGSSAGIGVAIGVLAVEGQPTPLLLVAVPLGVIIAGAASGISRGLESGLDSRIHEWLTGKTPRSASEDD